MATTDTTDTTTTTTPRRSPRMIFINLPVLNVAASTKFYTSIGGILNPTFSTPDCSCMVFSESIYVMIMTPTMFKGFCPEKKDVVDAHKSVQVLLCMSVDQKEDVDRTCTTASENGGKIDPTILKQMEGMYGRSFEDLDGHIWELMWMDPQYEGEGCPVENAKKLEEEAKKRGEPEVGK